MARFLPTTVPSWVVDPACGDGELLEAAWHRYEGQVSLFGADTDARALTRCEKKLRGLGAGRRLELAHGDFLSINSIHPSHNKSPSTYVIMNPPFVAYHEIARRVRTRLRDGQGLAGRFNLADAFVIRAVTSGATRALVALVPNRTYARVSRALPGITWSDLPDDTFSATIKTGILRWERPTDGFCYEQVRSPASGRSKGQIQILVRNGVATGADALFIALAGRASRGGEANYACARGRDVARGRKYFDLPRIWIPSVALPEALAGDGPARVDRRTRSLLARRYCVRVLKKPLLAFHEAIPAWFLGTPKIVVPEVCARLSVFEDKSGAVLPLHSTLAIAAGRHHRLVVDALRSPVVWKALRRISPRMIDGAVRLTAGSLRSVLHRYLRSTASR